MYQRRAGVWCDARLSLAVNCVPRQQNPYFLPAGTFAPTRLSRKCRHTTLGHPILSLQLYMKIIARLGDWRSIGCVAIMNKNKKQWQGPVTDGNWLYVSVAWDPCRHAIVQACDDGGPRLPTLDPEADEYVVHLTPVGVPCHGPPETEASLARAVRGVLRGLAVLHSAGSYAWATAWVPQVLIHMPP